MAETKAYESEKVSLNIKVQFQVRFKYAHCCVLWQFGAIRGNLKRSFFLREIKKSRVVQW